MKRLITIFLLSTFGCSFTLYDGGDWMPMGWDGCAKAEDGIDQTYEFLFEGKYHQKMTPIVGTYRLEMLPSGNVLLLQQGKAPVEYCLGDVPKQYFFYNDGYNYGWCGGLPCVKDGRWGVVDRKGEIRLEFSLSVKDYYLFPETYGIVRIIERASGKDGFLSFDCHVGCAELPFTLPKDFIPVKYISRKKQ